MKRVRNSQRGICAEDERIGIREVQERFEKKKRESEGRWNSVENRGKENRKPGFCLMRGYGSIRYLGPGRSRPYAVHPPAKRNPDEAGSVRPRALCYVRDWYTGFAVLTAWHAGIYQPGMELELARRMLKDDLREQYRDFRDHYFRQIQECCLTSGDREFSERLLLNRHSGHPATYPATIRQVYEKYYEYKFGSRATRKLSSGTARYTQAIAKKLEPIYDRRMDSLSVDELQELVNGIRLGRTMVSKTVLLMKELYRYALAREFCGRNPAQYVRMPDTRDYVHHQDFTDAELAVLWLHREDPVIRMILLMCYSGFRISAWQTMEIDLSGRMFRGGIKTDAGRNRIVPIHSAVFDFARELQKSKKAYLFTGSKVWFGRKMKRRLREIGIDVGERHHTPHSCRHTFSRLCESYGVREADRKRLLGHSFGNDLTNGVYGHRSVEELRREIEKIRVAAGGTFQYNRSQE